MAAIFLPVPERPADPGTVDSCGQPYAGFRPIAETYFVATAAGDTVPADEEDTFAQAVRVSRLGGTGANAIDQATSALLIPWGFDEQCRPIRWSGSWQWAALGRRGFYRGRLRNPDDWVDGRPTIDIFGAAWEGFPASPWDHPLATGLPKLTADELFDLYSRLPTREEVVARPYGAVSELVEWRRAAGSVADRYPAPMILESAFQVAEVVRVRQTPIPFAGSYRITVEAVTDAESEAVASFWLRTGETGAIPWEPLHAGPRDLAETPAPAGAVAAPAVLAGGHEGLVNPRPGCSRATALSGSETASDIEDLQGWRAELSLSLLASCFPEDSVLSRLRSTVGGEGDSTLFSGAFMREDDGRFTFRQRASLADGSEMELRGERIDMLTLPAVDPFEGWADDGYGATGSGSGQAN